jgi:hypothetical protein
MRRCEEREREREREREKRERGNTGTEKRTPVFISSLL